MWTNHLWWMFPGNVFKVYALINPLICLRHKGGHFITRGAVLHHSLSVNYWSKYLKTKSFQWYISANMSAFWSSCAPSLWVWSRQWGFGRARFYLFIWKACINPSYANVHLPAQMRSRCEMSDRVRARQIPQVTVSAPRWCPFLPTVSSSPTLARVLSFISKSVWSL